MALPKHTSRGITVDGRKYRWTVSAQNSDFQSEIRVSAGAGVMLHVVEAYSLSAMAITPRFVASLIRHAVAAGWNPELPGPIFQLRFPNQPGTYVQSEGATRFSHDQHVFDIPPEGHLFCSRMDLDPIREVWPWEHHRNIFVDFRLWKGVNDKAIGSFMASLAADIADPDQDPKWILKALARVPADEWHLSGGLECWLDGKRVMAHGCCVSPGDWRAWQTLDEVNGPPWNGHDPFTSAWAEAEGIQLSDSGTPLGELIPVPEYQHMLVQLEQDLRDFTAAVEAWLKLRTDHHSSRMFASKLRELLDLQSD